MEIAPIYISSSIFGIIGFIIPCAIPRGPNQGIIQCCLILTAVCCWLFWLCCYMAQMNPLIGPKLNSKTILMIAREWGDIDKL